MIAIHWFRRDLRLADNTSLFHALQGEHPVQPVFIFDQNILDELPEEDARVSFIHQNLLNINVQLEDAGASIDIRLGSPLEVWQDLITDYEVSAVYFNKDYEPYALSRDEEVIAFLEENGIEVFPFKDQVIFEESEVVKDDGGPYTVYTPYKNKWLSHFDPKQHLPLKSESISNWHQQSHDTPDLETIGFKKSSIEVKPFTLDHVREYADTRDFPALDKTSYLSPHLRFGTISPRQIIEKIGSKSEVFLSELIWREFFMQILFHFPHVVNGNFRSKYDGIEWRNDKEDFEKWCNGQTGYPLVDAGMRQLNQTGYMHNRVRMVTASFLCKHLLIDWRWGEAYFAEKLLDYELASNNGNWQWAAGTGCDAAPYFRVFNPESQLKKFDKDCRYVRRWVPEFGTMEYVRPMVNHKEARERALDTYRAGIEG